MLPQPRQKLGTDRPPGRDFRRTERCDRARRAGGQVDLARGRGSHIRATASPVTARRRAPFPRGAADPRPGAGTRRRSSAERAGPPRRCPGSPHPAGRLPVQRSRSAIPPAVAAGHRGRHAAAPGAHPAVHRAARSDDGVLHQGARTAGQRPDYRRPPAGRPSPPLPCPCAGAVRRHLLRLHGGRPDELDAAETELERSGTRVYRGSPAQARSRRVREFIAFDDPFGNGWNW